MTGRHEDWGDGPRESGMKRLPPLNALRAFEAAARFESFNQAARELHVTPSAISHQIRTLEEYLGAALFRRRPREVRLTETGREFLPPVRDALHQIGVAAERIVRQAANPVLTVSSVPSFAIGWLVPRLTEFQAAHPGIEVRLDTSSQLIDCRSSDVDACIRYIADEPDLPEVRFHLLFHEELVVVCSPDMVGASGRLRTPADLARVTLLHSYSRAGQWRSWLKAAGVEDVDPDRGPRFSTDSIAVEAAASGLGVALANRRVVENQVAKGGVVVAFDTGYCSAGAYYLLYPEDVADDPRIVAFREWLLGRVAVTGSVTEVDGANAMA